MVNGTYPAGIDPDRFLAVYQYLTPASLREITVVTRSVMVVKVKADTAAVAISEPRKASISAHALTTHHGQTPITARVKSVNNYFIDTPNPTF